MGCHSPLQGIFLTQGLNPGLLHLQADSLPSGPVGKPLVRPDLAPSPVLGGPGEAEC